MRVELINDAARRLLEPPVDPLGRSLFVVVRNRELIDFAESLRAGDDPTARRIEFARVGETRWLHVAGARVQGRRLRSRTILALHDLTDLRRLEVVRTDFVANASHEMRSPLASILGFAETLQLEATTPAEARDYAERIVRNARRLDDIIRDLIELSRLEHARAPQVKPTDVAALVSEVVQSFPEPAVRKRIRLEARLEPLPPRLGVEPGLVRQALANLVDNALKYTPEGGEVAVEACFDAAEGLLELTVTDSGAGIPPEHRRRVFERLYRIDPARSREVGGTGLGLAIVKHVAALHGGRVRLESEPGHGSVFRLVLPASPEDGRDTRAGDA
jgi:two-component system phosphate regulon sensor histidine kinase PhoR